MARVISSDGAFSPEHRQLLALLADMMIPADAGFPSAADPAIFRRTLAKLGSDETAVTSGLAAVQHGAEQTYQRTFPDLQPADRQRVVDAVRELHPAFIALLQAQVVGSYYQDDRVLEALGLPARSPHPGGHEVAATDWSLLDPVRNRKPFYRKEGQRKEGQSQVPE